MSGWEVWSPAGTDFVSSLTIFIPPLSHDWMCENPHFLSLILEGIVSLLSWVRCHNPQHPESLSHGPVEVWLVLIHQHHPLRHLPSSTTHEKEKANAYFRLSLCLFLVRSLSCLELFSISHLRLLCHQATCPASCLTIMKTIRSECTWVSPWL
jgi:hypothetical protein